MGASVDQTWTWFVEMPEWNRVLFALVAATTAGLTWAGAGAVAVCATRYRPCLGPCGRSRRDIRDGRRAWALALVFVSIAALGVYRLWWLWTNPHLEMPAVAVWLESGRAVAAVCLVWAFRE